MPTFGIVVELQTQVWPFWTKVGGQAHNPELTTNGGLQLEHTPALWQRLQEGTSHETQVLLFCVVSEGHTQVLLTTDHVWSGQEQVKLAVRLKVGRHEEQVWFALHWIQFSRVQAIHELLFWIVPVGHEQFVLPLWLKD